MSEKHTPGPWYVSADEAADCPDHHGSGLAMVDTGRSADWPIARLCEWNNARVIACLPDLLAALEAAPVEAPLGLTEMAYTRWMNDYVSWWTQIRAAALAKCKQP